MYIEVLKMMKSAVLFISFLLIGFQTTVQAQSNKEKVLAECARLLSKSYQEILSNPGQYASDCEKIIGQLDTNQDELTLAKLYCNYSIPLYYLGDYELCYAYNLKAIAIFEKLGMTRDLGGRYCAVGYEIKRRNLAKAFEYMSEGIAILENGGFIEELRAPYDNFGVLHEMNGNIDSALHYFNKSLTLKIDQRDTIGIPYSLNKIAMALLILNKPDSAKATLDKAISIRQQLKDTMGIAENYSFYGDFFEQTKDYAKAISYYQQSQELGIKLNYTYLKQYNAAQMALCYEQLGQYAEALKMYQLSNALKDSISSENTLKTLNAMEVRFKTEKQEKELAQQQNQINEAESKLKRQTTWLIMLLLLVFSVAVIFIMVYRQQKFRQEKLESENNLKDQIQAITLKNNLQQERLRISRDLHDNIGSQLTFIISSLDNIRFAATKGINPADRIVELGTFAKQTISQLRDTIWVMNKGKVTSLEIAAKTSDFIEKARLAVPVKTIEITTENLQESEFNTIQSIHLFRATQEAIQNAIKHAKCTNIKVQITENASVLNITIEDDGCGFNVETTHSGGNGLQNMESRMKEIGGRYQIDSNSTGTTVSLSVLKNRA